MKVLRRGGLAVLLALAGSVVAQEVAEVAVSNTTNVVNGDVSNIAALNANPGPDGISFREAILASQTTSMPKLIVFERGMERSVINVGSNIEETQLFILTDQLTIDGDIDNDGRPDITLDASGAKGETSFAIRGSRIVVSGLTLAGFPERAISISCIERDCSPKEVGSIRIENNVIDVPRGSGIEVSFVTHLREAERPFQHEFLLQGLSIIGNTISARDAAIMVRAGTWGSSRNRVNDLFIADNQLTAGRTCVDVGVADQALPPFYSEGNVIAPVTITGNTFRECATGIEFFVASAGGADNRASNVTISRNRFISSATRSISIAVARRGHPARSTSNNRLEDLIIEANDFTGGQDAIVVNGAESRATDNNATLSDNTLSRVTIRDNTMRDFLRTAIQVRAGAADTVGTVLRNHITGLVVESNRIENSLSAFQTRGIDIVAGESRNGATVRENTIRRVAVSGNTIGATATAVRLGAGMGGGARSNQLQIDAYRRGTGNNVQELVLESNLEGASENAVLYGRRRSAGKG